MGDSDYRASGRPVVAVLSLHDPNVYPALFDIACGIAATGARVHFFCTDAPANGFPSNITYQRVSWPGGFRGRLPVLRAGHHATFLSLVKLRPDIVICHHQYTLLGIAYKAINPQCRVVSYHSDYHGGSPSNRLLRPIAGKIDAYVDICSIRLEWRQSDWPALIRAEKFLTRQAPFRSGLSHEAHQGPARVVLTGSRLLLDVMDNARLSLFLYALGDKGVSVDWYMPGTDEIRAKARALCHHDRFQVLPPVSKGELIRTLRSYDVGLFWAPMADADLDNHLHRSVFLSAASNKLGEYIAAGLIPAHTGNPGLSYLPSELTVAFDPTNPVDAAASLAAAISDRDKVERMRSLSMQYHYDVMNFDAQAEPFIRWVLHG